MLQNLQFSCKPFSKQHPLANYIIMTVDHGSW